MNFTWSDDQQMLADSVARVVTDDYDFARRQRDADSESGFGRDFWNQGAELGWHAIPFPETAGGYGGGPEETVIVMEALGHGLVPSPYWASVVFAGAVAQACNAPDLSSLGDGTAIATVAYAESQNRYDLLHIATRADRHDEGWTLRGRKIAVPYAGAADWFVVPAVDDQNRVALFRVAAGAEGVSVTDYPTFDGQRAGNVVLNDVAVAADRCLADFDAGTDVLRGAARIATLALAAEAMGIVEFTMKTTLAYVRNRKQFGQPIGSFQALQHRLVDMFIAQTQLRSLLYRAVISVQSESVARATRDVAAVKHYVGGPIRKLGQEAIQLHGGMGVTWEMPVAHYFKRLTAIDLTLGGADHQLGVYANTI